MRPAVIVVDMVNDNVHGKEHWPITDQARAIIPAINLLLAAAHQRAWPVVFACDAFLADDFIFGGRMKPHSLQGTPGAQPIAELDRQPGDLVLPKRRFSAFFGTDLAQTLHAAGVDTVLVCGISTNFCVLTTALDALCLDLAAVLVEDCCAAARTELHEATLSCYRKNPLRPLLRVERVEQVLGGVEG